MQISIELSLVFVLLATIVVGIFVWLLGRSRTAIAVQQAVSESLGRLASSDQNLQFALQESDRLRNELASLEADCKAVSDELSILREQRAQLQVHADRIPHLELQLKTTQEDARQHSDRLIELNNSQGQKSREIVDLRARLSEVDNAHQQVVVERDSARHEA